MNDFLRASETKNTQTANGAVSHSTSGSAILDYFSKCSTYRNRSQNEVNADMASIFGENEVLAMKVVFYNRLVTRKTSGTEKVQRGQGVRDEYFKSLKWISANRPHLLSSNLHLMPRIGCWKDLWYDSPVTGTRFYAHPKNVAQLMYQDWDNNLIEKYLPKIRSRSNTKNERHRRLNKFARDLCKELGWTEQEYRQNKSRESSTAHLWQRQMCKKQWDKIDFGKVPGKALFNLTKGNLLKKVGQEKRYMDWLQKQPVAKFTGYVYELFMEVVKSRGRTSLSQFQKMTIDKQYQGLLEQVKKDTPPEVLNKGVWCALDTSASMTWTQLAGGARPYDVCLSLGIMFSDLIKGPFHNHVIAFSTNARVMELKAKNFTEKCQEIQRCGGMGSTEFQSVIDEIVRIRTQNPDIPVEDYPEVLLVCSDMQFNPTRGTRGTQNNIGEYPDGDTNYEAAMAKLDKVGLPRMQIIWWHLNGSYAKDVPNKMEDEGVTMLSGFDPSIITLMLGAEQVIDEKTGKLRKENPYEQMVRALDQEILNEVSI